MLSSHGTWNWRGITLTWCLRVMNISQYFNKKMTIITKMLHQERIRYLIPPIISLQRGVGNLNNPSNSSFVVGNNQTGVGKYSVYYKHASEEGTGTTDGFTTLTNWGYMDKEGTMYEMYWNIMWQDEVQDQLNYTEKDDISEIDILSHYWKQCNRNWW